jgi:hypothetical protein
MKPLRTLTLGVVATLAAMALVQAGPASAGPTALCNHDLASTACTSGLISHYHETSPISGFVISTPALTVICGRLFLGDTFGGNLANPLIIRGNFTYTGCIGGSLSCTVTEENAPAVLKVLRTGHETATVNATFSVHIVCGPLFNCKYGSAALTATYIGPLLATEANGEMIVEGQKLAKESGTFCSSEAEVDAEGTPLSATYISF